jgi:hypothetical protein
MLSNPDDMMSPAVETCPGSTYEEGELIMNLTPGIIGLSLSAILYTGIGLAAEPAEVEKYVKARIEIGEMMTNYFKGGEAAPPTQEQRREMGKDINAKLTTVLSKYGLTVEEYRAHSRDVFADEAAVDTLPERTSRSEAALRRASVGSDGQGRQQRTRILETGSTFSR